MGALDNKNRRIILASLRDDKLTISQLSKILGVSRPTVYLHLDVLEKSGLIERNKDQKKKGAPVYIKLLRKSETNSFIIKFLEDLEKAGNTGIKEKKFVLSHNTSINDLSFLDRNDALNFVSFSNLVEKRYFITEEGKKFLKENEQK